MCPRNSSQRGTTIGVPQRLLGRRGDRRGGTLPGLGAPGLIVPRLVGVAGRTLYCSLTEDSRLPEKDSYDAIVVGAGPGGSITALRLAQGGCSVLLLEKRRKIGVPVRCAEATGSRKELERFLPVEDDWISSEIEGIRLNTPGGTVFEKAFPGVGVMLDREKFDAGLARAAARSGAEIVTGCEVTGLLLDESQITGVRIRMRGPESEETIRTRLVVGADGVESLIGRWAGIPTGWRSTEIFSCLEAKIKSSRPCDGHLEFHFGNQVAPGGYGWAFPREGTTWNVGVGVDPARTNRVPARVFAERMIRAFDSECEIMEWLGGAACRSHSLKRIHSEGIVLVGDAAHQPNPLTGGGIMNAMEAGDLAGRLAAGGLRRNRVQPSLARYEKEWRRMVGRANDGYLRLADIIYRYDDSELESLLQTVGAIINRQMGGTNIPRFLRDLFRLPPPVLMASLRLIPMNRWAIF